MEDYITIGKTQKPFGLEGELRFYIEDQYLEDFDAADVIFLKIMGKPLPYFIESVRAQSTPLVKFEDVNTPEEAKLIGSCEIMMQASALRSNEEVEEEEMEYAYLIGFELIEQSRGLIGKVKDIEEYPEQIMALVNYEDKEVLIPLNEHFIQKVEEEEKRLYLDLPEGLLDI